MTLKPRHIASSIIALGVAAAVLYASHLPPHTSNLQTPTTPNPATTTQATTLPATTTPAIATKAGAARLYPNPKLTPGKALPVTAGDVCKSGYSKSVRNVSVEVKKQVYKEYGIKYPQPTGSYEVDHQISLELGGSNDISNLWPEPASPTPGFHEKDKVENYLHQEVCNGDITLTEAQKEINTDWYAVYLKIAK